MEQTIVWTIDKIEKIDEDTAFDIAEDTTDIKEHNIYFVDFGGYFGYSVLVFKDGHHIHYANDYELHHKYGEPTHSELRKLYTERLNNILFTDAELAEPLAGYDEYKAKEYFLHNYYAMRVDYVSIFGDFRTENAKKAYKKQTAPMVYDPVGMCYVKDAEFVRHHVELFEALQKAREAMDSNFEYLKSAYLSEMFNHEYGINWQADFDTLSAFGNVKWHGDGEDTLDAYFDDLCMSDVQRRAYLAARREYFKQANANGWI